MRFSKLGLVDQLFHTVASPAVAYLLLLIGLALLIFEFFTAGVGIAGVVGAACLVAGLLRPGRAPDATAGRSRVHRAGDARVRGRRAGRHPAVLDRRRHRAARSSAAWCLFEPLPGTTLRPSWITLIAGIGGIDADVHRRHAVDGAHPVRHADDRPGVDDRRARARSSWPSIPTAWSASAIGAVAGPHQPGDAVAAGDPVRVVAIDGVTLEVEPLEGAARDYRERRATHDT